MSITMLFQLYVALSDPPPTFPTQVSTGDLSPMSEPICMVSFVTCFISLGVGARGEN